ncbi:MAG: hypothetical protein ACFFDC_19755 [Promethearchaeota archaeon]
MTGSKLRKGVIGFSLILLVFQHSIGAYGITVVEVKYHSSVKEGAKFQWMIEKVRTEEDQPSWKWEWANHLILEEGGYITLEWRTDPDETSDIGISGPINYTGLVTTIGGRKLNFSMYETFFNFLIVPLYVNNTLGRLESGLSAIERLWFNSYQLPNAFLPPEYSEYIWNFNMENASLDNTGENAKPNSIVFGYIITYEFFTENSTQPETYVFDVAFNAETGFVKWIKYPSSGKYNFPIASSTSNMTRGLKELLITYADEAHENLPSFTVISGIIGLFLTVRVVQFSRRKKTLER